MRDKIGETELRGQLGKMTDRLEAGLASVDPHGRLAGRPVKYKVIGGQAFEITYREVPRIDEAQVLGVKKLIGEKCYCTVEPESADTLVVRFVIPV